MTSFMEFAWFFAFFIFFRFVLLCVTEYVTEYMRILSSGKKIIQQIPQPIKESFCGEKFKTRGIISFPVCF